MLSAVAGGGVSRGPGIRTSSGIAGRPPRKMDDQCQPGRVLFQLRPGGRQVPGQHDPRDCGDEDERVRRHMRQQRAPRDGVVPEATVLVPGLPVGLQEEVADQVTDDEHDEDLDPEHRLPLPGPGHGAPFGAACDVPVHDDGRAYPAAVAPAEGPEFSDPPKPGRAACQGVAPAL